jgi:hypothetical protein
LQIKPEHRLPTGNDIVAIPSLSASGCAAPDINVLSMKYRGMVEFHGTEKAPFFKPLIHIAGKAIELSKDKRMKAGRLDHWIPNFSLADKSYELEVKVVAPLNQRGFVLDFVLKNVGSKPLKAQLGAEGCWAGMRVRNNDAYELKLWKQGQVFTGLGTKHLVLMAGGEAPEFALAIGGSEELELNKVSQGGAGKPVLWSAAKNLEVPAGQTRRFGIFFGLGLEAVSAAAVGVDMRRVGVESMVESTLRFLRRRTKFTGDSHLDQLLNLNLWFNYFYAMGVALDTEDFCCLTSRSPHYYVNGAYWDRDSMLWSFPAVLMVDPNRARRMLDYAFGIQGRNIGVHSRFITGTILEPGFELDELCAPVIALSNYVKNTGDASLLKENHVKRAIRNVEKVLQSKKHPSLWLYETLSGPDDDFEPLPYLTYGNALVWRLQEALIELKPRMNRDKDVAGHKDLAEKVRSAVWKNLTAEGPRGKMFVWASDLRGKHRFYTSPPGCLQLLPYFGFCEPTEPVWRNTVNYLHSKEFQYSFAGAPFDEIGCAHAPQPWTLGLCNSMLSGQRDRVRSMLDKLEFDGGVACEAFDSKTGKPFSGLAFATCAGFLAWALWKAFGKAEGGGAAAAAPPGTAPARAFKPSPSPAPGTMVQAVLPMAAPAAPVPQARTPQAPKPAGKPLPKEAGTAAKAAVKPKPKAKPTKKKKK